ncbi:MAG: hypothetical protein CME31_03825 [Gimesia sp.]|jgi:hypothetical protein|uniref:Lipoprotein n=2 Tax=Gimesia maris TaxID=122 RepID=A0A3D3R845_9PLAN|nr:hypothetical protein [Gimesia sp.]HCO24278.1 hypothetical protein [Gimesia maris]|tara:strand:- start:18030 stop:19271 length:1242 start_codon:yes stop_codon:yes gene_type:complete
MLLSTLPGLFFLFAACADQTEPGTSSQKRDTGADASLADAGKTPEQKVQAERSISTHSRALFDWFDTLGVPDLDGRKYLQIYLGHYNALPDNQLKPHYTYVFLLESTETEKKVFTLGMRTSTYSREETNMFSGESYRYKEFDLRADVIERLKELRSNHPQTGYLRKFDSRTGDPVALFILARGCYGSGFNQQAEDLIRYLSEMPDFRTGKPVGKEGLKKSLSEDMALSFMRSTRQAFSDSKVGREVLLKQFLDIAKHYPESTGAVEARKSADILSRMIREDESHSPEPIRSWEKMTPREQVKELIYQLRDQNGESSSSIFTDPRDGGILHQKGPEKGSPATQLVKMGEVALEQLIEAVDDDSFTRCADSHHVIRVGDCCQTIIDRIQPTGRRFDIEGDPQAAKAAMKVWYLGN